MTWAEIQSLLDRWPPIVLGTYFLTLAALYFRAKIVGQELPAAWRRRDWLAFMVFAIKGRPTDRLLTILLWLLRVLIVIWFAILAFQSYAIDHEPSCVRMSVPC